MRKTEPLGPSCQLNDAPGRRIWLEGDPEVHAVFLSPFRCPRRRPGARGKVDAAGYIALSAAKTGPTGEQLLEAEPDWVGDTYTLHDREGSCKGGQYSRDPDPRGSIHEGDGLDTRAGDETCESPPSTPRHSVVDSRDGHELSRRAAPRHSPPCP